MPTSLPSRGFPASPAAVWIGGRDLPRGPLGRRLRSLVQAMRWEPPGNDVVHRVAEMRPALVVIDGCGSQAPTKEILESLKVAREELAFPVFLVLERGQTPPPVPADGHLIKGHGLAVQLKAVLTACLPGRDIRAENRRLTRELKNLKGVTHRLRGLVLRDDLTNLYNLRFFNGALATEHTRAARFSRQYSIVFMDLDGLREVNSRFGHLAGSRTLRRIGRFIGKVLREIDIPARIGGDEFVVICPETSSFSARCLAERIRQGIESLPLEDGGHVHRITASLGVASFPEDGGTPQQILERADRALYEAKARGKNGVQCWGDFLLGGQSEALRFSPEGMRLLEASARFAARIDGPWGAGVRARSVLVSGKNELE